MAHQGSLLFSWRCRMLSSESGESTGPRIHWLYLKQSRRQMRCMKGTWKRQSLALKWKLLFMTTFWIMACPQKSCLATWWRWLCQRTRTDPQKHRHDCGNMVSVNSCIVRLADCFFILLVKVVAPQKWKIELRWGALQIAWWQAEWLDNVPWRTNRQGEHKQRSQADFLFSKR